MLKPCLAEKSSVRALLEKSILVCLFLSSVLAIAPISSARAQSATLAKLATARDKSISEIAEANAVQAIVWGSPLVVMYNLRFNDALGPRAKAAPNAIWRMENISTPELSAEAGYVTPNVNTVYGFGFLDLGTEPIVMSVPDSHGRYYMVEIVDMWTNAFAYAGGIATGYTGGKFALVGPGWKGELPPDVKRIDCPTRWVMIQPRVHLLDQQDLPEALKVLDGITVQGLAAATGKPAPPAPSYNYPAPKLYDAKLPVSALALSDPLQFWEILADAMIENPPPEDQMSALLPMFHMLGLEPGKPWNRAGVNPVVLTAMRQAAVKVPELLSHMPSGSFVNGWFRPPPSMGNFGTDYLTRAVIARVGLTGNIPREAIYLLGSVTHDGIVLDGSHRYTVTFKEPPPFIQPGFWSLTMYDSANNYTVPNPINRYSLGSDDKAMKYNPDGSLIIYVQKDDPGTDKESNWLPAPPKSFYLILRSYAPGEAMVKSLADPSAYVPPTVALVK